MKVIISFAGLESCQEARFSGRPYALQRLAGGTLLGHILAQLQDVPMEELILVVSEEDKRVADWTEQRLTGTALTVLAVSEADSPIAGLRDCVAFLDAQPVLLVSGNYVAEADFAGLVATGADAACLIQADRDVVPAEKLAVNEAGFFIGQGAIEAHWAGACWFRHGTDLASALESLPSREPIIYEAAEAELAVLLNNSLEQGQRIKTEQAYYCLDTRSSDSFLHANARLLQLGHGSQDAIERSYAEDFTVLPPVFLHETAVVENVVIGPFVNLEANAVVRNSIVRNSLIGVGAHITNAILDGSFVGDRARISGQASKVFVGDEQSLDLEKEDI